MNNFLIIGNSIKDENLRITKDIKKVIISKGKNAYIQDVDSFNGNIDCIFVVGGDGTILSTARKFQYRTIPILGINLGTLGYLAEIGPDMVERAVDEILRGDYFIDERMILKGKLKMGDKLIRMHALNDIVLFKNSDLSMIRYNLIVNDKLLYTYNADGIIIATPTGSTGYSLSSGGPIVEPTAKLIVVTPISPHSLAARSVILSSEDTIRLQVCDLRSNVKSKGMVICDGSSVGSLECGDMLTIKRSRRKAHFLKLDKTSFLEILRRKMSV